MKTLGKIYGFIQPHIVTVFSVLLFASFVMVGFAFNFSVNRYITSGAKEALLEARGIYEHGPDERDVGVIMRVLRGNHRFLNTNVNVFEIDENYLPLNATTPNAVFIAEKLSEYQTPMYLNEGKRLRVNHNTFYISIVPGDVGAYIFYLDITETLAFTAVVNRLLIASVFMICLISMLIAGFLADSMMKPLKLLRNFVRQIGRGDFTPNSHSFVNEDFNELNQSLNNAARQLATYDNDQKIFFQTVSHELKTPLQTIKMYAELIQQDCMEKNEAADIILEKTNHLARMVDDILHVSRLDNVASLSMEEMNLCMIVEECIRQQRSVAESGGLKINYVSDGEPINVKCSVTYMERAVNNMISNAIRYAKENITVECYAIGSSATVRVSDDGPGFETEILSRVFERFYRGKGGLTGIGLSTVKSIIDQHKGSATAENGKDSGAVLTISIPRKKG
jgi:signal transduction histidine kinase